MENEGERTKDGGNNTEKKHRHQKSNRPPAKGISCFFDK